MNQHTTQFLANCARTVSFISTARDQEYQARSGLFRRPVNKRACGHFVSSIHRRPLKRGEIKGRKGHLRKKPFKINVWTCGDAGGRGRRRRAESFRRQFCAFASFSGAARGVAYAFVGQPSTVPTGRFRRVSSSWIALETCSLLFLPCRLSERPMIAIGQLTAIANVTFQIVIIILIDGRPCCSLAREKYY